MLEMTLETGLSLPRPTPGAKNMLKSIDAPLLTVPCEEVVFFNRLFVVRLPQVRTATHNLLVWKLIRHFSADNNGVYTISLPGDQWFMHLFPRAVHTDSQSLLLLLEVDYIHLRMVKYLDNLHITITINTKQKIGILQFPRFFIWVSIHIHRSVFLWPHASNSSPRLRVSQK